MQSYKTIFILILFFFSILLTPVEAVVANPNSGNMHTGITYEIEITADPPANATAVQLRLDITGLTVTGYTGPGDSSWGPGAVAACNSGASTYTSNSVCVDIAKSSGTISSGESLGSFYAYVSSEGSASIVKSSESGDENAYLVDTTLNPDTGTVATFTVDNSLPETGIKMESLPNILLGMSIVTFGLLLYLTDFGKNLYIITKNRYTLKELLVYRLRNIEVNEKRVLDKWENN